MKISVLQPNIIRGNIEHNMNVINRLLQDCEGNFAVLAEYAITGSLVLDEHASAQKWAKECETALKSLVIPEGKVLLVNHLINDDGNLYNQSTLPPAGNIQRKCFPDPKEVSAGISPGKDFSLFSFEGKKYKVIICTDLRNMSSLSTEGADFAFFIFHFTMNNQTDAFERIRNLSINRKLPIIVASLCSDKNCGHSMYVNGTTTVSLGNTQSILEINI